MNAPEPKAIPSGLELLREPFPPNQISRLPKPTKQQTEAVRADFKKGVRCKECGAWHHPDVVHLDYVGHAALTDRLLDADPLWNWEFAAAGPDGLPLIDKDGGFWIKLTVCGVTRLGYGDAQDKTGGNAMKERIGDALRNAAMRFGAALDLWHKGDLHGPIGEGDTQGALPAPFGLIADPDASIPADAYELPPKGSGAWARYEAYATSNQEERKFLNSVAANVQTFLADDKTPDANTYIAGQKLDNDQRTALSWVMGAKAENTLKAARKAQLEAAKTTNLAEAM